MSRAQRAGTLRRWAWALVGAGLPLTPAQAAVAVPDEMLAVVRRGEALTLIVEIDAATVDAAAATRRAGLPRRVDDAASLATRAAGYRARKDAVFAGLQRPDIETVIDYANLPQRSVRVRGEAALRALAARPGVRAVFADREHSFVLAESLPQIGQPAVAAAGYGGSGSTVAVIDNGIDRTRGAFGGCTAVGEPATCRVVAEGTFVTGGTPATVSSHGTNVAAIVVGVAPQARIAALNVFKTTNSASTTDILSAIDWVITNRSDYGIVAMNLSLGDASRNDTQCAGSSYAAPFANARAAGIHVVAAAGNFAFLNNAFVAGLASPACAPGAVSVGAVYDADFGSQNWLGAPYACTDPQTGVNKVACFSMSSTYLSLLAPGAKITAGGFIAGGTSQAAPHVAGALAVLRSAFGGETPAQVETRLTANGTPVFDTRFSPSPGLSFKRLNLAASARPSNDDFTTATTLPVASGSTTGFNRLATLQPGEPAPAGSNGRSVWWAWTAPAAGQMSLNTAGSGFDTRLDVYTGGAVGSLGAVAGNDSADGTATSSSLRFQAAAGITYRIAVSGVGGASGDVALGWSLNTTAQANLSVNLAGPASAPVGATVAYTLTVANAGPQSATGVLATVTLPAGLSVVSLPSGCALQSATITCSANELANGASMAYTLTLRVDSLAAPVSLSASLSSELLDSVLANNTTTLALAPGAGDSGDIPTLPEWAALALGGLLIWLARFRDLPRRFEQHS